MYVDFCNTINSVTDTVSSFSCLVKRAEESVEKLSKLSPPVTHSAPVEPIEPSVSDLPIPEQPELDDSVYCVLNNVFNVLNVNDILAQIPCVKTESHGRKTAYFGNTKYSYGTEANIKCGKLLQIVRCCTFLELLNVWQVCSKFGE